MSYRITKNNNSPFFVPEGGKDNTTTELTLLGKDYFGYGEHIAQNFVDLLENFASQEPTNKTEGMLWFNTANDTLNVWKTTSVDTQGRELGNWLTIDPALTGPTPVQDSTSSTKYPLIIKQDGIPVAAYSSEADYTLLSTVDANNAYNEPMYPHFQSGIKKGITLASTSGMKFHGTATTAEYADLAEMYASDADYEPGTLLKIGGEAEVTQTTDAFCPEVFGIVSTNPAYLMNSAMQGTTVAVALSGRVPCKVVGEVKKGQRLVASEEPGVARAATGYEKQEAMDWNRIVGRALEDKTTLGVGTIEVVVGAK